MTLVPSHPARIRPARIRPARIRPAGAPKSLARRHLMAALLAATVTTSTGQAREIEFEGCSATTSEFFFDISSQETLVLGVIPAGLYELQIFLESASDIDLQLIDAVDETLLVLDGVHPANPNGILSSSGYECADYLGLEYCYSGYFGVDGNPGHEFITVSGITNRPLRFQVFGFQGGTGTVEYVYQDLASCGSSFEVPVQALETVQLGDVPLCIEDLRIEVASSAEFDLQLIDETDGTVLVGWPDGLLNGAALECVEYQGVEYCYSGTDGIAGVEFVEVHGVSNRALSVQAFGSAGGTASVSYSGTFLPACADGTDNVAAALPLGCGVNPSGSLTLISGDGALGSQLVLGVDNPLGTQSGGSSTVLMASLLPAVGGSSCGIEIAGFGMTGPGAVGELLVSPIALVATLIGDPWSAPGVPSEFTLPVPVDYAFAGVTVYMQGFVVDPAGPVELGITDAVEVQLGY